MAIIFVLSFLICLGILAVVILFGVLEMANAYPNY
jgi:hypothetical protein